MGQTSILSFIKAQPIQQAPDELVKDEVEKDTVQSASKPRQTEQNQPTPRQAPVSISAQLLPTTTAVITDVIVPDNLPNAAIVKIQPSHLPHLKNVTATIFPVKYSDKFFAECISSPEIATISRTLLYDSKVIGLIRCRIDPFPSPENPAYRQIYIQTIGVLAPYRSLGLATRLLNYVVDAAGQLEPRPTSIYAHVWEANADALEWYCRRGFARVNLMPQYYRRLQPSGAWVIRRELG